MSDDLPARLRAQERTLPRLRSSDLTDALLLEAAAEIERLRADDARRAVVVREINAGVDRVTQHIETARRILREK